MNMESVRDLVRNKILYSIAWPPTAGTVIVQITEIVKERVSAVRDPAIEASYYNLDALLFVQVLDAVP